jgi:ABC-type uncharacterized transport system involved in gliding motility auxiliary subunit
MKLSEKLITNLNSLLFYLLLAVVVGLAGWLSNHFAVMWDLSAGGRNSLTKTSQTLLSRLEEPLHITSFAPESAELRNRIREIIDRYKRYRPDINFTFVDPDKQPELVRQLGIQAMGELRLEYQGRAENLKTISEETISNTIQHLMQGGERWIGVVIGHGERSTDGRYNHDLGGFGDDLRRKGYKLQNLNLSETVDIPHNLSMLIIASPQVSYLEQEVDKIISYINSGGNLLWLLEPGAEHGLGKLKQELGLVVLPGTIVDANAASYRLKDPTMAIVTNYPNHPATAGFSLVTLFPHAAAMLAVGETGWVSTPLLSTLTGSWNETGKLTGEISRNQEQGEIAGPLDIGIAFTRKLENRSQIVMAIGDGDFLSNSYLGNGGNLDLGVNLIRWLSSDIQLLNIPARTTPDLKLDLTKITSSIIGIGFLLVLPLVFLSAGAAIWWHRRSL